MPLTPLVLGDSVTTNINTDPESSGNVTGGVFFYGDSFHCFPDGKFATAGQASFSSGGFLVGKDGNVNAVTAGDCFGVSLFRVDSDRSVHLLASLQLTGSEDAAGDRFQTMAVRVSDSVMLLRWSVLVSIDSDDIPVYIAFGEVEIDADAETLTENVRDAVDATGTDIHSGTFTGLYYTMDDDGRVLYASRASSAVLKIGVADTLTGTIDSADVNLTDLPAPGSAPNWNQGETSMWRDETGTAYQRTSTRQASTAGSDWDVWQGERIDDLWTTPANIAPSVDPDDPWLDTYIRGRRIARHGLYNGAELYTNVVGGNTYEMGPVDSASPTAQDLPVVDKIVDPETFSNLNAHGYPQGSEATPSLIVGLNSLLGTVTHVRVREYLSNGVEHGAWRTTATTGNQIYPCDLNRQYFVQRHSTNTNLVIWFTSTPTPLPSLRRWWLGVAGWS